MSVTGFGRGCVLFILSEVAPLRRLFRKTFYLSSRKVTFHFSCGTRRYPAIPADLQEYLDAPSTKLDAVIKILLHHQANPGASPLTNASHETGQTQINQLVVSDIIPEHCRVPETPAEASARPRPPPGVGPTTHPDKVVLYIAFPSHFEFLQKVSLIRDFLLYMFSP